MFLNINIIIFLKKRGGKEAGKKREKNNKDIKE